uniref:Uncharacterized protein n=1 Tax=Octopus bimaculoides TaxID=37653 RepID=A0A0L8HJB3_OCTBM
MFDEVKLVLSIYLSIYHISFYLPICDSFVTVFLPLFLFVFHITLSLHLSPLYFFMYLSISYLPVFMYHSILSFISFFHFVPPLSLPLTPFLSIWLSIFHASLYFPVHDSFVTLFLFVFHITLSLRLPTPTPSLTLSPVFDKQRLKPKLSGNNRSIPFPHLSSAKCVFTSLLLHEDV